MTKAEENILNGKAEAVLMGFTQKVESNAEAIYIIDYIVKVTNHTVKGEEIIQQATQYSTGAVIQYINISTLEDMIMLTLPMITEEDEEEFNILSPDGVFCYVYNFTCPDFSELGYSYFENKNGRIRRIG